MPDVTAYVDDRKTSEFYPTPEKLVQRMLGKIKWDPVEAILEPSAGKGKEAEMKNPCGRDCPDRSETCHGECEKYKAWKAENDQQREAIKEFKRQDYALRDKTHLNRREKH